MPKVENDVPRVVTETLTWGVVTGPKPCRCGHVHYGRVTHSTQAPQYHLCENESCPCRALRPIPPGSTREGGTP